MKSVAKYQQRVKDFLFSITAEINILHIGDLFITVSFHFFPKIGSKKILKNYNIEIWNFCSTSFGFTALKGVKQGF